MFGLIGHLTSLEHAKSVAGKLGYPEYADQGLDFWCSAPPLLVDHFNVTSVTGQTIEGKYVESCFVPEMLANRRIKAATRKVLNAMAHAQKLGINITALGGFSSIIFENFKLEQIKRVRNLELDFKRFTTGNTHTAYVICKQVEEAAPDLAAIAARVISEPCWAVMAAFEASLPLEADSLREPAAAISWAARNSSKPHRTGAETWVLHASPKRSREVIDLPKDYVAELLLADYFAQAGIDPVEPVHIAAHRWLYAQPASLKGEPARYDEAAQIGIAGDYLHSPRVEGAWVSGSALAQRVLGPLP